MKKVIFALVLSLLVSCTTKINEQIISDDNVEFSGNGFKLFSVSGDVKIFAVEGADKLWTLKASVPMKKNDNTKITTAEISMDLLDSNNAPVHGSEKMSAVGLSDIIPVFNSAQGTEKNVIFAAEIALQPKAVASILEKTVALNLSVSTDDKAAKGTPDTPTLSSLLEKYGCWGLFAQYDRACRDDDEDRQDRIEDKFDEIIKMVKKDPAISEKLADRFDDYIDDKLDQIEDKY